MATSPPAPKRQRLDEPNGDAARSPFVDSVSPPTPTTAAAFDKASWPGWCTVESEPAVFNQLLQDIGVSKTAVEEIYALEKDTLEALSPAYGLIFLFRWKPEPLDEQETVCPDDVWFANQVVDNACASFALLNIVFNSDAPLGPALSSFRDYSKELTPPLKGLAVANFEHVRRIHNSFGRAAEMADSDINLAEEARKRNRNQTSCGADEQQEVFHFIAYVHVGGAIWELDGLKRQPVKLHVCENDMWLSDVFPLLQARVHRYHENELLFNLLAVVPEKPNGGIFGESGSTVQEAQRRKQDYESIAHNIAMILEREQVEILLYE